MHARKRKEEAKHTSEKRGGGRRERCVPPPLPLLRHPPEEFCEREIRAAADFATAYSGSQSALDRRPLHVNAHPLRRRRQQLVYHHHRHRHPVPPPPSDYRISAPRFFPTPTFWHLPLPPFLPLSLSPPLSHTACVEPLRPALNLPPRSRGSPANFDWSIRHFIVWFMRCSRNY